MKLTKDSWQIFKLTFKLSKKFYIVALLKAITNTAKTIVGVYGLSLIVKFLIEGDLMIALYYAGAIVSIEVIVRFLEITLQAHNNIALNDLVFKLQVHISSKLMKVEYKYLEDPKYLETVDKSKAAVEIFNAHPEFLTCVSVVLNQFLILVSLLSLIIIFKPIVILVIIVGTLIRFYLTHLAAKKQSKLYEELGPVNRKLSYFDGAVQDERYQKDYRLYPLGDMVYRKFNKFLDETCNYLLYFYKILGRNQIYFSLVNSIQVIIIYLILGPSSITDGLGVATYILLTASAFSVANAINEFVQRFSQLRRHTITLKPFIEISNMKDAINNTDEGIICEPLEHLRFENVSFSYPRQDKLILDDISFEIKKGEKISIVGLNGAGKTTIVKLISRFYQADKGCIYWNDVDINDYEYHSYIKQISAVFQDFKLFALTISENVDVEEIDKAYIKECLYQSGLEEKIESLPNKIDSFLSKEYSEEGIDLSGGEKQKVAIARAMYQKSSIAILDEPTSALDPLSEAEIYGHFAELVKDKTTIYISHRMSSSVFCDRIIVLDKGKIVAMNSHKNLMKEKSGIYYELFSSQANYYI